MDYDLFTDKELRHSREMTEELITFETAKLAKKKGFGILTSEAFINQKPFTNFEELSGDFDGVRFNVEDFKKNWNTPNALYTEDGSLCYGCQEKKNYFEAFSRPTQSLLQRWLREERYIHLEINVTIMGDWYFTGYNLLVKRCAEIPELNKCGKTDKFLTYELALEAGLLAALKLIK